MPVMKNHPVDNRGVSIFLLESMRDEESTSNQKYQLGISSLQQCIEGFDVIGFSTVFDGIE